MSKPTTKKRKGLTRGEKADSFNPKESRKEPGPEKLAAKRLAANGRQCDGCGVTIGRFTSSCFYDPKTDRAYCSTGGCAERWEQAPKCKGCKTRVNPFDPTAAAAMAAGQHVCSACAATAGEKVEQLDGTKEGKRGGLKRTFNVVRPQEGDKLTEVELAALERGPYSAVQREPGFFQVLMLLPNEERFVRGTFSDRVESLQKAARFNEQA